MITKFKIFENVSELPKVGDYVIINPEEFKYSTESFKNFIFNQPIGQIEKITIAHGGTDLIFNIKFNNIPEKLNDYFNNGVRRFSINYLKYWSERKEDLEKYITAKKYNL